MSQEVLQKEGKKIIKYSGKDHSFPKFAKTEPEVCFQSQY